MKKEESNYNLIDWWKKVMFENYANFKGRARRAEYWYFALGNFLLLIPFYVIQIISLFNESIIFSIAASIFLGIFAMAVLIPSLAVAVRRLHDINKSGWYYFISVIPFIGTIILLVWLFTDGDRFINNYGNDPKNPTPVEFDFEQKNNQS